MDQKSNANAPSVREAVRKINGFKRLICAQEAFSRGGEGGLVRIEAMTPVMDAIDQYAALFPAVEIER
ncbi:hypothetical protein [Pseudomonas sp. GL-B-26]|uniref:hypothetical protein n=1 Tax=Pseudomonas sp. GL-B-26 TaxID=2832394 RepID=UPI001CC08C13|nr:hypothetical protein [Pseudomonas sp. GL-B-26]